MTDLVRVCELELSHDEVLFLPRFIFVEIEYAPLRHSQAVNFVTDPASAASPLFLNCFMCAIFKGETALMSAGLRRAAPEPPVARRSLLNAAHTTRLWFDVAKSENAGAIATFLGTTRDNFDGESPRGAFAPQSFFERTI